MNLKTIVNFNMTFLMLLGSSLSLAESVCPTAPNEVRPSIVSDVKYNQSRGLYTYSYTLANGVGAKLPISGLRIYVDEVPLDTRAPQKWAHGKLMSFENMASRLSWLAASNEIASGSSLSGFQIISSKGPGVVKYSADGPFTPPMATPTETDDEPQPDCPNFYLNESGDNGDLMGVTIGPVGDDQISADILIREGKRFRGKTPKISPMSSGKIFVLVLGNEDLDVKDIDLDSVEFGFGKAKPLKHKIVFNKKPFRYSHFLRSHLGKNHKKHTNDRYHDLLLEFDLDDVGIRCDLDHALFLTGKVGEKNLVAATEFKSSKCNKEMFKKFEERRKKWKSRGTSPKKNKKK